jgi:5-methyltetrahydropteroyltriglutamate--homocysteine methyltransferase
MATDLPLLTTSVVGSHAYPGWLLSALEQIDRDKFGATDIKEAFDDAVNVAMLDQQRAGVDVISDGEMRRWYFVQSFYRRFKGLVPRETLRKTGVYGYDSVPRWTISEKLDVPEGLGIVEEFQYAKAHTDRPLKATSPGPLTLTIHLQLADDSVYKDRLALAFEFADVVNKELKGLVDAGAEFIQLDEPSYSIIPGSSSDWIDLFNKTVEGVDAKIGLHICFGNLASRPRGKRRYGWMMDDIMRANAHQIALEFANREMVEVALCQRVAEKFEVSAGLVDVKSFYVETPEDVAERVRRVLDFVPPEKLWITPDCGFFQLPRWLTCLKLRNMVKGVSIVRKELEG